jgi:hypothetical protein
MPSSLTVVQEDTGYPPAEVPLAKGGLGFLVCASALELARGCRARVHAELLEDPRYVPVDGSHTQEQQAPQSRAESVAAIFDPQRERASEVLGLNGSGVMMGEFVEVDPYQRIVLTWGWEQKLLATPPQSTLLEVSFTPDGEDTILQVAQRRVHPPRAGADLSFHLFA